MSLTKNLAIVAVLLVIILTIIAVYIEYPAFLQQSFGSLAGIPPVYNLVSLQLTDPPTVPLGTTSLLLRYSGVAVHTTGGGWVNSSTSGSADLLQLVNFTQTIANVNVAQGSQLDMVRFDVSSSQITINGTRYNVTIPSGKVTAKLDRSVQVNSTLSILVDLAPTIVTIYTNTSQIFILVPSVKAIAYGGSQAGLPGAPVTASVPQNAGRPTTGHGQPGQVQFNCVSSPGQLSCTTNFQYGGVNVPGRCVYTFSNGTFSCGATINGQTQSIGSHCTYSNNQLNCNNGQYVCTYTNSTGILACGATTTQGQGAESQQYVQFHCTQSSNALSCLANFGDSQGRQMQGRCVYNFSTSLFSCSATSPSGQTSSIQQSCTYSNSVLNCQNQFLCNYNGTSGTLLCRSNYTAQSVGTRYNLNAAQKQLLQRSRPNVTITSSTLSTTNNVTRFSITVRDNSDQSVVLYHAGVFGTLNVRVNNSAVYTLYNSTVQSLANQITAFSTCQFKCSGNSPCPPCPASANLTAAQAARLQSTLNGYHLNIAVNATSNTTVLAQKARTQLLQTLQNRTKSYASFQNNTRLVLFQIGTDGSLSIPSSSSYSVVQSSDQIPGYALQPGQSVTFIFTGIITPGYSRMIITPMIGGRYMVGVQGSTVGLVSQNITASS